MKRKQIVFVAIYSGNDQVLQIDNGPVISSPVFIKYLGDETNGLYVYNEEDDFLYTEVNEDAEIQTIHLLKVNGIPYQRTSVDFFGGRPQRPR